MLRLRILCDLGFEFWMDIPGFEGYYQASTYGRIKSVGRIVSRKNRWGGISERFEESKILDTSSQGWRIYYTVNLKGKWYNVHKLVSSTFISNPDPKHKIYVNHKDENKHNNACWNLEYVTPRENTIYGTGIERARQKTLGVKKYYNRVPIIELSKDGEFIKEWDSSVSAAEYYKINRGTPRNACKNGKLIKGHKWMKASEYYKEKGGLK